MAILGLALVLATVTIYAQSAQAVRSGRCDVSQGSLCTGGNVINPGGAASGSTQDGQGQDGNSQGNGASGANGGLSPFQNEVSAK